jgi:hypothetical protein
MGATSRSAAKARRGAAGWLKRRALASSGQDVMTKDQKVIRAKVGLLELAKQLGNISQACKMMGYSRDKNRVAEEIESAIVALAIEQPAFGKVRVANELRSAGLRFLLPARAACGSATIWKP